MKHNLLTWALVTATALAMSVGPAVAQAPEARFVPFAEFVDGLSQARPESMAAVPGAAVESAQAAEEMRQHLRHHYDGINVAHSFVQAGQMFDCVPVDQQPSAQHLGLGTVATPPPTPPSFASKLAAGGPPTHMANQHGTDEFDGFGNARRCDMASIPMRRVTLSEVSRFETLHKFFSKGPDHAGQVHLPYNDKPTTPNHGATPPSAGGHTYAHAYQYVNNYGGYSIMSLYRPYVDTYYGEVFSLSQQWYVGGAGAGLQTAEVGLQNYPAKYGSENSMLFVYWTADNYNTTGCYNLDCAGFVQINGNWTLGSGFANYSTVGGAQYDIPLGFFLWQGNWWLAVGNEWVGYYPGSLYGSGQMSQYAQLFDLGGETVGASVWPGMGSGQFASAGWPKAAYHRAIWYRTATNAILPPSLTASQSSPNCETITNPYLAGGAWLTYFFFGGPGGSNC